MFIFIWKQVFVLTDLEQLSMHDANILALSLSLPKVTFKLITINKYDPLNHSINFVSITDVWPTFPTLDS